MKSSAARISEAPRWLEPSAAGAGLDAPDASLPPPPPPANEVAREYAAGSPERERLDAALREFASQRADLALVIGGREVRTGSTAEAVAPHRHRLVLADVHQAGPAEVGQAIAAARTAWQDWQRWPWTERAAIFLRAAALVTGRYREQLTAATMLDQSKTVAEAEADAAGEFSDFLRFGVHNLHHLMEQQPHSTPDAWNHVDYRPLEGFVYAATPFNFTAIAGNLPTAPVLMGNTSVWKPSPHAMLAPSLIMRILAEAGLPDGVVNLVHGDAQQVSQVALSDPNLAGVHYTGSTAVFQSMWQTVGDNMSRYRSFPRLVGETGGKGFVLAHPSADVGAVVAATIEGGCGYQGQKCSAASRVFIPASMWAEFAERAAAGIEALTVGDVSDPATYLGGVISAAAFERHRAAIEETRHSTAADIIAGGGCDDGEGWFVQPTLIRARDPGFRLLRDELFGPIITVYVYEDSAWSQTLDVIDESTPFALTGSLFANDRRALAEAKSRLRYTAGNLYVNDKPTGAFVGRQPFGGSRASGTNDMPGTLLHAARWTSGRTIKDAFTP